MKGKETKTSKKIRCQDILKKGIITDEDEIFLRNLLKLHPNYEQKKGVGIESFFIKETTWKTNGFFIKREDNSETDFSYKQCLLPRTHLQKVKMACRSAIAEDVMFKSRKGYISHHKNIPFIDIFNLWIKEKNIDDLEIKSQKDNCFIVEFKDKKIAESFRIFHNSLAEIEEVSQEEHKKIHEKKDGNTK